MGKTDTRADDLGRLMEKSQWGDERAYLDLLEHVAKIARAVVRHRAPRLQLMDVEDLVQEVLASVHVVRATYDPSRPFRPWLLTIVHNRMIDRFRKFSRGPAHEILVQEVPETFSPGPANYEGGHIGDEDYLRQAIRDLPTSQRLAIELVKLQELSLNEASRESGLTIGNLKILVHRAIKTLRKKMVPNHD